jgi:hypothetical protein
MNNWKTNVLGSVLMIASLTGCQTLTSSSQAPVDTPPEKITVQIRAANRKPKNIQVALTPNMRLQDIVNGSKANFRNKTAYIVRTSPKTGEKHKLEANFGTNRRISLETDYAIQPGDRVVVAQDATSSFDKVMKSMFGRS